jgi:hypothetical protein
MHRLDGRDQDTRKCRDGASRLAQDKNGPLVRFCQSRQSASVTRAGACTEPAVLVVASPICALWPVGHGIDSRCVCAVAASQNVLAVCLEIVPSTTRLCTAQDVDVGLIHRLLARAPQADGGKARLRIASGARACELGRGRRRDDIHDGALHLAELCRGDGLLEAPRLVRDNLAELTRVGEHRGRFPVRFGVF